MALIAKYSLNWNANEPIGSFNWTPVSTTWVAWKMNQWASFDWTSSRIQIPNTIMNSIPQLSVNCFITFNTFTNSSLRGIIWAQTNYSGVLHYQYYGTNSSDQIIQFNVWWQSPWAANIPMTIALWKWYMLTTTYSNTLKSVSYYLNAKYIWWQTFTTAPLINVNTVLDIWRAFNTARIHSGLLDELEIYNHLLTQTEITNKYLYFNWFM